jgi:hypothetical protein
LPGGDGGRYDEADHGLHEFVVHRQARIDKESTLIVAELDSPCDLGLGDLVLPAEILVLKGEFPTRYARGCGDIDQFSFDLLRCCEDAGSSIRDRQLPFDI